MTIKGSANTSTWLSIAEFSSQSNNPPESSSTPTAQLPSSSPRHEARPLIMKAAPSDLLHDQEEPRGDQHTIPQVEPSVPPPEGDYQRIPFTIPNS